MSRSEIQSLIRSERSRRGWSGHGSSGLYTACNPTGTRTGSDIVASLDIRQVDRRSLAPGMRVARVRQ